MRRSPSPLLPEEQRRSFTRLVKRAFSQRRKMMFKLLKADWPLDGLQRAIPGEKVAPQNAPQPTAPPVAAAAETSAASGAQ